MDRFHVFLSNDDKFRKQIDLLLMNEPVNIELDKEHVKDTVVDLTLLGWVLDKADGEHIFCISSTSFTFHLYRSGAIVYMMLRTVMWAIAAVGRLRSQVSTHVSALFGRGSGGIWSNRQRKSRKSRFFDNCLTEVK